MQAVPETIDQARVELDQLDAWMAQYEQMQAGVASVIKRQAFLQGLLLPLPPAAEVPATNGSGDVAAAAEAAE